MSFFATPYDKILVIAPFPPSHFAAAEQAAELVHCLAAAEIEVQTMSAVSPSYCQKMLRFAPKRRFLPILKAVLAEHHDVTVFYPQALGFGKITQRQWKHRRLEEWRRLKLMVSVVFKKPKVVIAYPTGTSSLAEYMTLVIALGAKVFRPFSVKLVTKKQRGASLAAILLGQAQTKPSLADAEQTLFNIAKSQSEILLTPRWLRNAFLDLPLDDPLKDELRQLVKVADQLENVSTPFEMRTNANSNTCFDDPILAVKSDVPISKYMDHLRHSHKINHRFSLETSDSKIAFLRWYLTQAPKELGHSLPLNAKAFAAIKQDYKLRANLDHVAALRNPETKDIILPAYFLALHRSHKGQYKRFKLINNAQRVAFALAVIIDHSRFHIDLDFLGDNLLSYFMAPVGRMPGNISRIELLLSVLGHAPVENRDSLTAPWAAQHLSTWCANIGQRGYPLIGKLSTAKPKTNPQKMLVTGDEKTETGLSRNHGMSLAALKDVHTKQPVYLHHVNASEIPAQMLRHNQNDAFHIGFLLWELEMLPRSHMLANDLLDEIWAPSNFVKNIYQEGFERPVVFIGKGFDLPDIPAADLSPYGIETGQTVFLNCFDIHSSVERKNPLATVKAFLKAFPFDQSKRLIIKTTPPPRNHWGDPHGQMEKIIQIAANDNRIILDQRMLPFRDLLALVRAADCVVSSHRAEGFGYFPAYAMKYGRPVIATDYSGTTDFCTAKTSFPTGFNMKKVGRKETIFPVNNARWADVHVGHLAQNMREVAGDLDSAFSRAKIGQDLMNGFYSKKALRQRYFDRLNTLGLLNNTDQQDVAPQPASKEIEPAIEV